MTLKQKLALNGERLLDPFSTLKNSIGNALKTTR